MKRPQNSQPASQGASPAPQRGSLDPLGLATLAGVVVLLMLAFSNMRDIDRIDRTLGERLTKLETQIAQVAARPAAQPAQQQGPDPNRVYAINIAKAPVRGPAGAPIVLAEFSDFQWPFCSRVGPTLKQIEERYGDTVKIAWKHLPLDMHKEAMGAHLASMAASKQGKFWEYHDKLFANQSKLKLDDLKQYARELKLDMARFEKDLVDLELKATIEEDKAEARKLGITGTPGFFVNGRFLRGAKPFEEFADAIDAELKRLNLPVPPRPSAE